MLQFILRNILSRWFATKICIFVTGFAIPVGVLAEPDLHRGSYIRWYDSSYGPRYKPVENGVVRVNTESSSGSGVYVTRNMIATNAHVVGDYKAVEVRLSEGKPFNGEVVNIFKDIDLALIFVHYDHQAYPAQIGRGIVTRNQKITAQGFPQGRYVLARSTGTIINVSECCIYHNALIAAGSSGGPLFDQHDRLIGINTLLHKDRQDRANENDLSIAVSMQYIMKKIGINEFTYRLFYLPDGEVFEVSPSDMTNKECLDILLKQSSRFLNKRKNKNIFYLPNGDIFNIEPDISDEEAYGILMRKENRYLIDRLMPAD